MVMRNGRGGSGPGWWDDLPPAVRQRVSRPEPEPRPAPDPADPPPYRPAVLSDLTRLGLVFLLVALSNLLFLLLALSFLSGRGPFAP
jgi:hypothetical protein